MRKWIRVAVAVLLLLVAYFVPWSETELHKRRCEAAWSRLQGKSVTQRLKLLYYKITKGNPPRGQWNDDDMQLLNDSRQALFELGYLVRQPIAVKNLDAAFLDFRSGRLLPKPYTDLQRLESALVWFEGKWLWSEENFGAKDGWVITAPRSEMSVVSNLVMRIDQKAK